MAGKGFGVTALDISDRAIEYAVEKADKAGVKVNFLIGDFVNLPFKNDRFKFAFDFGCFHHVEIMKRAIYIKDVYRVLKSNGIYLMVCFSDENGPAWNHFRRDQIIELFEDYFEIDRIEHVSSIEADNVTRFFYETLMRKID